LVSDNDECIEKIKYICNNYDNLIENHVKSIKNDIENINTQNFKYYDKLFRPL